MCGYVCWTEGQLLFNYTRCPHTKVCIYTEVYTIQRYTNVHVTYTEVHERDSYIVYSEKYVHAHTHTKAERHPHTNTCRATCIAAKR